MISANQITKGQVIYCNQYSNADGSKQRWKVTSIKRWKSTPHRVQIGLKRGLYEYVTISESGLVLFDLEAS